LTVELLGEVGQLEPQAEGAKHERLLRGGKCSVDLGDRAVAPRLLRGAADPLHELQQPGTFLLDEDDTEQRPEQAHIAA